MHCGRFRDDCKTRGKPNFRFVTYALQQMRSDIYATQ